MNKENSAINMNRYKSREQAFLFIFEKIFNDEPIDELIEYAASVREEKISEYAKKALLGVYNNVEQLDLLINENTKGWKKERLPKSVIAILRLAIYEMLFEDDIPVNVSINEAVELAKKFCDEKDVAFINGILGTISKENRKGGEI